MKLPWRLSQGSPGRSIRPAASRRLSSRLILCILWLGSLAAFTASEGAPGDLDTGFDPNANGSVRGLAVQADGKVLLGGEFTTVGGVERYSLARLNADGMLDSGFNPYPYSLANILALQMDGKMLAMESVFTGGLWYRLARLNGDGTRDSSLNAPETNDVIRCLVVQADGKILIGGDFTTVGGVARNRVARLNADGTLDTGFDPNVSSSVYSLAVQEDGKVLMGGVFFSVGGVTRNYVARLNADGTLDTGFNPNPSGDVQCIAVQADGKVLIGGAFTYFWMGGVVTRARLARLNADGTLDSGFNPSVDGTVYSLALQADGKVLLGGSFYYVGGVTRNRVARLNADGTLDSSFNPNVSDNFSASVLSLAVQADGRVILGGIFTTVGGVGRNNVARVVNDAAVQSLGIPDSSRVLWSRGGAVPEVSKVAFETSSDNGATWTPLGPGVRVGTTADWELAGLSLGAGAKVRATGLTSSGPVQQAYPITLPGIGPVPGATATSGSVGAPSMILGGAVISDGGQITERGFVYAVAATNANPQIGGAGVTRLVARGAGVGSFNAAAMGLAPGVIYSYRSYAMNPAGTVYSNAGIFTSPAFGSVAGDLENGFNPNANGDVRSLAVQVDGKVLIGGGFTTVGGVSRSRVARLNADGTLDTGFNPNVTGSYPSVGGSVTSIALQADGKILIGGSFGTVGGFTRNNMARLNADGTLDSGFNPNFVGEVKDLMVQADGKVLVGGDFSSVGGVTRSSVARLNADGTLDSSFNPAAITSTSNPYGRAYIYSLALQADGKVLVGGSFTTVGGVTRNGLTRLNADGTLDNAFNPNVNTSVSSMVVQADGRVLIGGGFNTVGGLVRNYMARLNADGTLDTGFTPNANSSVSSLVLQVDGKVLVVGSFTAVGEVTRKSVARLNPDGTLDSSFNPDVNGNVLGLAVQADGKVLLGGSFTMVGGAVRNYLARVANDSAVQSLGVPDSTRVLWSRGGTAPEVSSVIFETSTDNGASWSPLGIGVRVGTTADWELAGLSLASGAKVRATGRTIGGFYNGSSGLVRQNYPILPPGIGSALDATETRGSAGAPAMMLGGIVTSDGDDQIIERGFVYAVAATNANPQIGGMGVTKLIAGGTEVGGFNAAATGLAPATTYSYRSYATNSAGTVYSAAGTFTTATSVSVAGDIDSGFNPDSNEWSGSLAVQADGKVLIGGYFTSIGGVVRNRMARLSANGTLDTSFNPNANGGVRCIAVQADGKVLMGGDFTMVGGVTRNYVARLNADGTLDTGFNPNTSGYVSRIAVQPDGKVLMAGWFTTVGDVTRNFVARLNADGTLDTGFNPTPSSEVSSLALQADGKVLIGGFFTTMNGVARNRVARLNADGTLDAGFDPNANSVVHSLAALADGKVLMGGEFTTVGGLARRAVARLNADGTLDAGYNPGAIFNINNPNAFASVFCIVVQADRRVLLGGGFTSVGGVARNFVARLNVNGTLDTGFDPNANRSATGLAVQADGKVLLGGSFTRVGGAGRNYLARVANDAAVQSLGVPDSTRVLWSRGGTAPEVSSVFFETSTDNGASWTPLGAGVRVGTTANWELTGLSLASGAKVRATGRTMSGAYNGSSGFVRQVYPVMPPGIGPVPNARITSGSAGAPAMMLGGTVTSDGDDQIIERGFVYAVAAANANPQIGGAGVTKLTAGGTEVGSFNAVATGLALATTYSYRSYATNSAGTVYSETGTFTTAASVSVAGGLDTGFNPNVGNSVNTQAVQADGKVILGGFFSTVGGVTRNNVARLNPDGTLDTGFNPNASNSVNCIALQADGKVLLGGAFTTVGGITRNYVARLNADGTLDTGFNPNANDSVSWIAAQADGKVLLAGNFTTLGGVTRRGLARLNADGTLDTSFNPNLNSGVSCFAVQADGKVLIVGGGLVNNMARLNPDGTLDTGFNSNASGPVSSMAIQADGRVLIGGGFSMVNGVTRNFVARLNADGTLDAGFNPNANSFLQCLTVQADGRVLIGGFFTTVNGVTRNSVARLNADGTLDTGFNPDVPNSVYSLAVQADGKVLIGGLFFSVGGVSRTHIARVANDAAVQNLGVPDSTRVLWNRGGAAPEVSGVIFETSTDNGASWSPLCAGMRVGTTADWELAGLSLAAGAKVRATGRTADGSGSSGLIRQVYPSVAVAALASTAVGAAGASLGAHVTLDENGAAITERGVVFAAAGVNANPVIGGTAVTRIAATGTTGAFTVVVTGLSQATTYSYRGYVVSSEGISYTSAGTFTTLTLHQNWRQTHFGSPANTGSAADGADPDGDGLSNLLEYALNLPPNAASRAPASVQQAGGTLEYLYTRGTAAFNGGTSYQVEWSDDLLTWSTAGVVELQLSDDGTYQQMKATLPAGSSGQRFVRLRVQ